MTTNALPTDIATQLEALREIRLPGPVSWWPLAPGWWILAAAICLSLGLIVLAIKQRRGSLRARALRELAVLREQQVSEVTNGVVKAIPSLGLAEALSALLRRVAIQGPDGKQHATQYGEAWSDFLMAAPGGLPSSVASFLSEGPYAASWQNTNRFPDTALSGVNTAMQPAAESPSSTASESVPAETFLTAQVVLDAAERWIRKHT